MNSLRISSRYTWRFEGNFNSEKKKEMRKSKFLKTIPCPLCPKDSVVRPPDDPSFYWMFPEDQQGESPNKVAPSARHARPRVSPRKDITYCGDGAKALRNVLNHGYRGMVEVHGYLV